MEIIAGLKYVIHQDDELATRMGIGPGLVLTSFFIIPLMALFGFYVKIMEEESDTPPEMHRYLIYDGVRPTIVFLSYTLCYSIIGALLALFTPPETTSIIIYLFIIGYLYTMPAIFPTYMRADGLFSFSDFKTVLISKDHFTAIGFIMTFLLVVFVVVGILHFVTAGITTIGSVIAIPLIIFWLGSFLSYTYQDLANPRISYLENKKDQ